MAIIKKTLFDERLETINVLVNDTDPNSKYFKITELPDTLTGGKNAFLIQGSPELVLDTIVKIQIRDAQGNIIYHEPGEGIPEYFEGTSKVVAVYIYPDTAFGPCTITILGELSEYTVGGVRVPVPENWKDTYNVKWEKQINVNPILANTSKIRFYRRPKIDITESILPIYNRVVNRVTISGSVNGTPITPAQSEDYRTFKGVSRYELSLNGSNQFSESMERETIEIGGLAKIYSPNITDVTTNKKAFVDVPYYTTSSTLPNYYSVNAFESASFTMSYDESILLSNSSVSSSFATINITDLESFSGDVNRIKVYASSKNDLGDFQLLEDVQLESNELLLTSSFANQLNVRTGLFTTSILNSFWTSSTIETTGNLSIDNTTLLKSVVLAPQSDYSSSIGLFKFYNSEPISFTKNTEYQLDFTPLLSSANDSVGIIEVYMSGSSFVPTSLETKYGKKVGELTTNTSFRKYDKQQINFKPDNDGDGNLVFVIKSGVWHIADISLRAAQESSFSPNEITLTVNVPVKINNETFDFKFELYDINNNYVPVLLEKEFTFVGGNDVGVSRDLRLNVSNNSFNFSTASAFPSIITIDYTTSGMTGSVTFQSQSVDVNGNLIVGTPQPGTLDYVDIDTRTLSLANFTGSSALGVTVGAISYTASCEDINRYFTIFRIDQGAPARLFFATADKNTFVFDPDDRYKSDIVDDYIDIRMVRQNLPAYENEGFNITSGSEVGTPPALTEIETVGNATIYRLYVTSSTHQSTGNGYYYDLGQSHYDFKYDTVDGDFTSSVTIDAVLKGDKGKGLIATSDANQFFYKMTDLSPTPSSQTITILAKRLNLGSLTNTITITSGSGVPALSAPTYEGNGVSSYTIAAGQSSNFQYNTSVQTYTFTAYDLNGTAYNDEVTLSPVIAESQISVNLTNENATLPARSTGWVASGSFVLTSGSVSVKVGNEDINREEGLTTNNRWDIISATGTGCTPNDTTPDDATYGITALTADSGSLSLLIRYKDGRGTSTDITKVVTYTKAKASKPNVLISATPQSQTVAANAAGTQTGALTNVTISALEGTTDRFTSMVIASSTGFSTTPTVSDATLTMTSAIMNADEASVTLTVTHTDSEGSSGQTQTITIRASKIKQGESAVLINLNPTSQIVTRSNTGTYAAPTSFTVSVKEGATTYTYDNSSPYAVSTFRLSNVVGGTNNNDGTITPTTPTTTAGTNVTFDVVYVNQAGTEATVSQTHRVSVALDGQTGPGVVFTGVWAPSRAYQFSAGAGTGRRDVVLWSTNGNAPYDVYYAAIRQHTSAEGNVVDGAPNQTAQTGWESLGTEDFFVAAKIGLFEESYVQNTLNIGTNNNGGVATANITLAGGTANPYISIGQTVQGVYGADGIYIGNDGGNYRASFVNGTTSYLKWTGDSLDIKGSITITGGDAATQTYAGTIGSNAVTSGSIYAANAAASASISASAARTAAELFAYSVAGANAVISGSNAAAAAQSAAISQALSNASASINLLASGGWVGAGTTFISANSISSPIIAANGGYISGVFKVGNNGITLDGINKKIFVGTGNYNNADTPFYFASGSTNVFSLGNKLSFSGTELTVSGTINATGGNFSGNINATGTITGGTIAGATLSGATGNFSGVITSTSGLIGGWEIANSEIKDSANKMKLVSTRPAIEIYEGNDLRVDISAAPSLSVIVAGSSTVSNVPYSTTLSVQYDSYMDSLQNEANQNDTPSNDPLISTGGTVSTFTPNQTGIFNAIITLGGTHSNALGQLEPNGISPAPVFLYLYASYTVGISIRTGGVNGTEVANLSTFVNWSRVLTGTNINESSTPNPVLTGNLSVTSGTVYYLVPYIESGQISTLVTNGNFDTNYLRGTYRTPTITAASISKSVSKTELVAGGFQVVASTDRYCVIERNSGNADFVSIGGGLTCTGDVTANTSSDRRWKDNILRIENPIEKIKQISGNTFIWKEGYEKHHSHTGLDYGVIAQEIEEIMPEIVVEREGGFKGVRYEKIIPLLIEAIKEQQKQIDELKNK